LVGVVNSVAMNAEFHGRLVAGYQYCQSGTPLQEADGYDISVGDTLTASTSKLTSSSHSLVDRQSEIVDASTAELEVVINTHGPPPTAPGGSNPSSEPALMSTCDNLS
jgi:hypothetical protein